MTEDHNLISLKKELFRRIALIEDPGINAFTIRMLQVAPESFWLRPSSLNHHPLDERRPYGNLKHTIRVVRTVGVLCDVMGIYYAQMTKDMMMSAAVLHDIGRHGMDGDADKSVPDHPKIPRQLAEKHGISCGQSSMIFMVIEKHMGRWGEHGYTPLIAPWIALHVADAICAHMQEITEL